ncbi:urea ABC transporter substrate-binding protein [Methyloversatilis sp. XJ19-13]|jgi:urea transport system substrate-binding protein|uniref:urea ABC transporter substrate-binding protein n=1 Tax=unclassified Methyloversatilis TaxID=2639971 RepID=UPI000BC85582|nr:MULTISPECIES: urea ABC transporter substrate-binding protein [unclassified Methyloversatilis]MBL8476215.1 urea ABC transporter substrate-binding protein [Methyloversatilis sp.]MCQ9375756.1 urea ABC transporter substrate-binding protein [Methyloversatilis sp. XJ19-13]MDP3871431.1 urea ABC transporter substrate-binding protein [Methyloversatilis sp.]OYW32543.1 MAG: urea ABC transporter substrate-binding protein [Methyloversatilis sp. 12-65-5]
MKSNLRRDLVKALALASVAGPTMMRGAFAQQDVVKVGILHSLTGTIALAEASVVDAEKLAIDEINAAGGVLGKKIVPVVEDGASDWPTFAEKARKLLGQDKVAAVFGCYTSASRKAVLPVFEQAKGLLYYPTYYEGQEQSPNILYTAHEATQQCVQGCNWLLENRGKTFYLIGSDYIWPRVTNKIARPTIVKGGGSVLGEEYMPLGSTSFGSTINKIKAVKPDIILSTIVGGSNVAFYKQLKAAGVNMKKTTVMAFAVSEEEVSGIGNENVQDVLTCMSYLQSLDNPANKKFVAAFKAKYGQKRVTGDTLACAYTAVYLWKMAVEKAKSFDVDKVIAASANLEFTGPEGLVRFHGSNHHLWKQARIGAFGADGQVNMIYESPLIEPNPFPTI